MLSIRLRRNLTTSNLITQIFDQVCPEQVEKFLEETSEMLSQVYSLLFSWPVVFVLLAAQMFPLIEVESLSIHSIEVPAAVMNSSQVTLVCNFSLLNEQLYSVKWYKNYVEFYRFQPLQADNSGVRTLTDNQQHSKQEFELDGISLNLSKSNATHVFLKQTNLNSEGTYKCEVSADSPSFATVSIERKMKVYVLPKQKLSIVDNNNLGTNQHTFYQAQQQQIKPANTYHINDIVNLTCISTHSHPGAKLTWFINDSPVINSSRWLTHHYPSKLMLNQPYEQHLIESRLTLSIKIQPYHLSRDNSSQSYPSTQQRYQFLRFRCLAMLSVEFDSETGISVSSGRTTVNKKNRSSQIAARLQIDNREMRSTPSPYMSRLTMSGEQEEKLRALIPSHRILLGNKMGTNLSDLEYFEYRWPQPIDSPHKMPSERKNSFTNAWITSPVTTGTTPTLPSISGQDSEFQTEFSTVNRLNNNNRASMRQSSSVASLVPISWTNKQIKLQSEFIDQMLQITHANELDTPTIEARLIRELPDSSSDADEDSMSRTSPTDSDISSASMFDDTFTGEPEARTTFNEASTGEALPSNTPDSGDQNYELNDMVRFTCNPRIALSDRNNVRKNFHLKWFVNNKEINAKQINSFDGSKFYHTRDTQLDSSHALSARHNSTSNPNRGKKPYQAESISLIIEFTPSLFQIKELNLKCRTIVEQPLIEFEQQLAVSVPSAVSTNQHQFIQTVDQRQKSSNTRNQFGFSNRQSKRRDKNPDGLGQLLPSSSGINRLSPIDDLIFRPIFILIYSITVVNYFLLNLYSNTMSICHWK